MTNSNIIKAEMLQSFINTFANNSIFLLLLFTSLTLSACGITRNPATGKSQLSLMSEVQEFEMGYKVAENSLKEFGGTYDEKPELTNYLKQRTAELVAVSERSNKPFEFRLLDDPIVNAFAVPGYTMLSRGILPLFDNEAQLMAVLGHEIGHVTAFHHVRRHTAGVIAGIAAIGIQAATSDAGANTKRAIGYGLGVGLPLGFAYYSRSAELEADSLGLRYINRLNYRQREASEVFRMFGKMEELNRKVTIAAGGNYSKNIFHRMLSTHPDDKKRIDKLLGKIKSSGTSYTFRNRYLDKIDGLAFGTKLEDGVISKGRYLNPKYQVKFNLPKGYLYPALGGKPLAINPKLKASVNIVFEKKGEKSVLEVIKKALPNIKGLEVYKTGGSVFHTGVSKAGEYTLRFFAMETSPAFKNSTVMVVVFKSLNHSFTSAEPTFYKMIDSFQTISKKEAETIEPLRVKIYTVGRGETISTLTEKLPIGMFKYDWFNLLNPNITNLKVGDRVKLIVDNNM